MTEFLLLCFSTVVCFFFNFIYPLLCDFKMGILNLNGARADFKRAALFKLVELKRLNIVFLQETRSDWKRSFNGKVILSPRSSVRGGIVILFPENFLPASFKVDKMIARFLLKVVAFCERVKLVFLNFYAPTRELERVAFFRH